MKWFGIKFIVVTCLAFSALTPHATVFGQTGPELQVEAPTAAQEQLQPDKDPDHSSRHDGERRRFGNGDRGFPNVALPIACLLFALMYLLGQHLFRERKEKRQLELISTMLANGQTVPEPLLAQIMANDQSAKGGRPQSQNSLARTVRRGVTLTFIGGAFLVVYFTGEHTHKVVLIAGIIMLGLALGNLASLKFHEKNS